MWAGLVPPEAEGGSAPGAHSGGQLASSGSLAHHCITQPLPSSSHAAFPDACLSPDFPFFKDTNHTGSGPALNDFIFT